ncbi:gas vesicle protein [Streptomyces heilongjiangensis]|nr:gas vesicle protein [Streptomyces heilongjiangensis]MDC2947685.1 gas vesicle protein [Streptomyces heilongjiangensis]
MSNTSSTSNTHRSQKSRTSQKDPASQKNPTPQDADEPETGRESSGRSRDEAARSRPTPMQVLRHARDQLAELTGLEAESVSSFERTEDGWALEVEVLEMARVPDTMSLLASYQVELDADGELTGYRRVRRYERGRADARRSGR